MSKHLKLILLILSLSLGMSVQGQTLRGRASYYSNALHGNRMSDGTPYDKNKMTCAHRTLPLGTWLRVTNPANGKSVKVKVTDRGPHHKSLVIDLSRKAAERLDIIRQGTAKVVIEVLRGQHEDEQ